MNVARGKKRGKRRGAAGKAAVAVVCVALLASGCESAGGTGAEKAAAAPAKPKPARPAWNTHPESIASLGDSITRGFDACSVLKDCPEASWATGTSVDSLARRLLASPGTSSWNHARTGARMADLPEQTRAAVVNKPQLVTVLMGANDACRKNVDDMTTVDDFRADFEKSLRELRTALPKSQVYVAGVPDLRRLWAEGRKSLIGPEIWKLGSVCPSMLADSGSDDAAAEARRVRVEQRVLEYNTVLKSVCARDELCRFDGSVHGYGFSGQALSKWDWFHPSKQGQGELAALAYRTITSAEPPAA
ncbi:SGNH/GDSL hydrolase family protein [Streptomyces sp. NPDC001678]|uniref:SGNH/GDSL hydrolase family protein n=1 Tax=Streptomyces sp. NPDC001678 TaxID=3364599 RepID=UPI0036962D51